MSMTGQAANERRSGRGVTRAIVACTVLAGLVAGGLATAAPKCSASQGQSYIEQGRYDRAVREFTCVIEADPSSVDGYRGRIEARLLLGLYAEAYRDYARMTAFVLPAHPDAESTIVVGYQDRLAENPTDVAALTGLSFARWNFFDYPAAIHLLDRLLEIRPDDVYGTLFRGSSSLLKGVTTERGIADLDRAIALAPTSPDVRYIAADAYTYGLPDPVRAYAEASRALDWGLDTPRVHAILGAALNAFGDLEAAAAHVQRHIELVTTELVPTPPLSPGQSLALELVPGRTYEIPVSAVAGATISIATRSKDYWDSIAVLIAPDGTPVVGSDDDSGYFAAFEWAAEETGTYRLLTTFFESVNTGVLNVTRD